MPSVRKALYPFGNLDVIRIPGVVHGLGSPFLEVTVWDTRRTPWLKVVGQAEVDPVTADVVVTMAEPLDGVVVLLG